MTGFNTDRNWRFTRSAAKPRSHFEKKSQVRTSLSGQRKSARKTPGFSRCDRRLQGSLVKFDLGWVQSLAVQTAVVCNIQIAIGDNRITYGLLGQDFLARFDVRILEKKV
ncbi:hypothetical protein IQ252_13370 [Tychonema sp. LEGE 07203]|nr:hypothetical protein [Tychonema sp. LEGE 07203]